MYLYILQSERTGRYYIGASEDIGRRIGQHNNPLDNPSRWTRRGGPWTLIFQQKFSSATAALRVEKYVKQMKSRKLVEKIVRGTYRIEIDDNGKISILEKAEL